MALTLTYLAEGTLPVEVPGVIPDRLRSRTLAEIQRLEVPMGSRSVPLARLFRISGDPADGRVDFEGNLSGVHFIGCGMTGGEIRVHGDAGRHLGGEMTGGEIRVEGNAGDWVGGEMHGGVIHVDGLGRRLRRLGLPRQQARDDRRHDPDRRRRRAASSVGRCGGGSWRSAARAATRRASA